MFFRDVCGSRTLAPGIAQIKSKWSSTMVQDETTGNEEELSLIPVSGGQYETLPYPVLVFDDDDDEDDDMDDEDDFDDMDDDFEDDDFDDDDDDDFDDDEDDDFDDDEDDFDYEEDVDYDDFDE
jgi:hypothetical protein